MESSAGSPIRLPSLKMSINLKYENAVRKLLIHYQSLYSKCYMIRGPDNSVLEEPFIKGIMTRQHKLLICLK